MKGFVELRRKDRSRRLVSIDTIVSVNELNDGGAFLELYLNKRNSYGFETFEDYEEVCDRIRESLESK